MQYGTTMTRDPPPEWRVETRRTYSPADRDDELEYATYRHESDDLRVRIAPASLDGEDRPGYTLQVTSYPGLEFSESETVRYVLRFDRCEALARRFMTLFSATYDGAGTLETALEYARDRTAASAANDAPIDAGPDPAAGDE